MFACCPTARRPQRPRQLLLPPHSPSDHLNQLLSVCFPSLLIYQLKLERALTPSASRALQSDCFPRPKHIACRKNYSEKDKAALAAHIVLCQVLCIEHSISLNHAYMQHAATRRVWRPSIDSKASFLGSRKRRLEVSLNKSIFNHLPAACSPQTLKSNMLQRVVLCTIVLCPRAIRKYC